VGDILTAEEVAQLLQLRPSTVHDMARRGALPSLMLGKHRRFHRDDVTAYIDALRSQSQAENRIAPGAHARVRRRR
jgi:excisionase family DNA binding protein